jgi:hypothetical protein
MRLSDDKNYRVAAAGCNGKNGEYLSPLSRLCRAAHGVTKKWCKVEDYRAKAKEYARLTVLAEMYWALALGEESQSVRPSKMIVKTRSS